MRALITGITGQDGAYLAKFLIQKGYEVFGLYRRTSCPNMWRLLSLGIQDKIQLVPGDMIDMASISNAILQSKPDEIYNRVIPMTTTATLYRTASLWKTILKLSLSLRNVPTLQTSGEYRSRYGS